MVEGACGRESRQFSVRSGEPRFSPGAYQCSPVFEALAIFGGGSRQVYLEPGTPGWIASLPAPYLADLGDIVGDRRLNPPG